MNVPGRKRRITDKQVKRIREWVSLTELCRQIGVRRKTAVLIRSGYQHKQPSP